MFPFENEEDKEIDKKYDFEYIGINVDDFIAKLNESPQNKAFTLATKLKQLEKMRHQR